MCGSFCGSLLSSCHTVWYCVRRRLCEAVVWCRVCLLCVPQPVTGARGSEGSCAALEAGSCIIGVFVLLSGGR